MQIFINVVVFCIGFIGTSIVLDVINKHNKKDNDSKKWDNW